jgi:hypothetical protein
VTRPHPMVFQTALKNGPAAPELRRDAHDCIMVAILTDQPNTRLRGTPRQMRAPLGIVIVGPHRGLARPPQPAAVLATVKGKVAVRWRAATLDWPLRAAASQIKLLIGTRR